MLILTRRLQESFFIEVGNEKIKVTMLKINGNQIRVGIDAPSSIGIVREELYYRDKKEDVKRKQKTSLLESSV